MSGNSVVGNCAFFSSAVPGRIVAYVYSHSHENAFIALSFPSDFILFPIRLKARGAVRFLKFQDFLLVNFFAFISVLSI